MISLIMATLGRYYEVDRMLESLTRQKYKNFELVVVDQNPEGFLSDIIEKYSGKINIKYINTNIKGLSKARNIGLKHIQGAIVAFPDDDCVYFEDTLLKVQNYFLSNEDIDFITGKEINDIKYKHIDKKIKINKYNIWLHSISFTIFMRKKIVDKVGFFDEQLGVGSGTEYGSGEETDYLLRGLENTGLGVNVSEIVIMHPRPDYANAKKAFQYSKGRMYVLRKHNYGVLFKWLNVIYPLIKLVRWIYDRKKIIYHWYQFTGRL